MDAKAGANTKSGKLTIDEKSWSFPLYEGTIGPAVMDIGKLYSAGRHLHLRPGLHIDRQLRVEDHLYRRR